MFKVGDRVKCIKSDSYVLPLYGSMYTVRVVNNPFLYLAEVSGGWNHERFELVDDGRTSRTTDPITSKGKVNKYEQAITQYLCVGCAATGKEIAAATGHPLNYITPRFAPLRRKGLIRNSGVKRGKQIVWVLA